MLTLTAGKKAAMDRLSTQEGIISALAIDQRGALKKMIKALDVEPTDAQIETFKELVSKELTPYASAILLDPEYGLPAAKARDTEAGLLLAYEKTGYDATTPGRLPDLLADWSVLRLKEEGADAIKFLLYYDVDEDPEINHQKHVFIERLGSECAEEDLPFYLELVSYDAQIADATSLEATDLPFICLSAGFSTELFQETLRFAKEAGSTFNGVLCGRATWKNGVKPFVEAGETAACDWLKTEGRENIESLNEVIAATASSWHAKVQVNEG